MKALVTGAAGFIGSHLCRRAARSRREVIGLDCFTDYYPRPIKEANLAAQPSAGRGFASSKRASRTPICRPLLDGVTHVFHLAAQAGVRKSWGRDFRIYTENNVDATQQSARGVRRTAARIASSTPRARRCTATTSTIPMREDALPQPVSPYGVTKLAAEQLCYLYFVNHGVPTTSRAVLHGLRPAPAPGHGVQPVHPGGAAGASRSRSTATASRRATSRSWTTPSRRRSPPASAACRDGRTTSAAARA